MSESLHLMRQTTKSKQRQKQEQGKKNIRAGTSDSGGTTEIIGQITEEPENRQMD